MPKQLKIKTLEKLVGKLSEPSKMPGYAWGINPRTCVLGSILRKQKGTTCNKCYAFRGNYRWPIVWKMQAKRLLAWQKNPFWKYYLAQLIELKAETYFRWFDSGDLQSEKMLADIVWIAKKLPNIKFWLPTRETTILSAYLAENEPFPKNLTVRVSATIIGELPSMALGKAVSYSTVGFGSETDRKIPKKVANNITQCEAHTRGNVCGPCRKCWNPKTRIINYPLH